MSRSRDGSEFVAFDGEGVGDSNHNYVLLANSLGEDIRGSRITWDDALPFLADPKLQKTKNVWFAFSYDINMLGKYEPEEFQRALYIDGEAERDGYTIRYLPRKILKISKGKLRVTHYDTWGFFQSSFLKALEKWKLSSPPIIAEGKKRRERFVMEEMDFMVRYNAAECKALVTLMSALEEKLNSVGVYLRSYHGAGAIASDFLREMQAPKHYPHGGVPKPVHHARFMAYFGGRVELTKRGEFAPVYSYDINSCYPSALLTMPSLRDKKWRRVSGSSLSPGDFALVNVEWDLEECNVAPLPLREEDNYVRFPLRGSGIYYNSEVQAAKSFVERWGIGGKFKLGSAYLVEKPYEFPYRAYIERRAAERLEYKSKGDMAHIPLKLGLNALYGKTAQRPTRTSKSYPPYRELLVAGHITAHGRRTLLDVCKPEASIMFATDSVKSLDPLNVPVSEKLGEWEYEKWERAVFVLSGVYGYEHEGEWVNKTRGYHELDVQEVFAKCKNDEEVTAFDRQFIGVKKGLAQRSAYPEMCRMYEVERGIDWNNNLKRSFRFDDYSLPADADTYRSFPYSDKFEQAEETDDDNANA